MNKNILIFTIIISLINCSSNEDSNCNWETITATNVPQEAANDLNRIFSKENAVLNNAEENNFILKITTMEQLSNLSEEELDISIDFNKYFIIGGRVQTNSISNKISNDELKVCNPQSSYQYEIAIEKCTECYPAIGFLYYWKIYPIEISKNEIKLLIN